MFLHEAVLEGLLCSQTLIPVGNLMIALRNMNKHNDFLKSTPLQAHFDVSDEITTLKKLFTYTRSMFVIYTKGYFLRMLGATAPNTSPQ